MLKPRDCSTVSMHIPDPLYNYKHVITYYCEWRVFLSALSPQQIVSFPVSYGKNPFAYSFKQSYPSNGWTIYDPVKELKRLVHTYYHPLSQRNLYMQHIRTLVSETIAA